MGATNNKSCGYTGGVCFTFRPLLNFPSIIKVGQDNCFLFCFQCDLAYELESRAQTLQDIINGYVEVETGLEVRWVSFVQVWFGFFDDWVSNAAYYCCDRT